MQFCPISEFPREQKWKDESMKTRDHYKKLKGQTEAKTKQLLYEIETVNKLLGKLQDEKLQKEQIQQNVLQELVLAEQKLNSTTKADISALELKIEKQMSEYNSYKLTKEKQEREWQENMKSTLQETEGRFQENITGLKGEMNRQIDSLDQKFAAQLGLVSSGQAKLEEGMNKRFKETEDLFSQRLRESMEGVLKVIEENSMVFAQSAMLTLTV